MESGIVPSAKDGALPLVASDNHLTIGHQSKPNNSFFIGVGIGPQTLYGGRVEEMAPRAMLMALSLRGRDIMERRGSARLIVPFAGAAFRLEHPRDDFTDEENQLHKIIMGIIHDPSFAKIVGAEAMPRMVYQPVEQKLEIKDEYQFQVPLEVEPDPARLAYMDEALRKEANVELIPGLTSYFKNIQLFLEKFTDEKMEAAGLPADFITKIKALRNFHAANGTINLSDVVAHPGRNRKVIYMDPKDYETLFATRSTKVKNFLIETQGERLKMQPFIGKTSEVILMNFQANPPTGFIPSIIKVYPVTSLASMTQ